MSKRLHRANQSDVYQVTESSGIPRVPEAEIAESSRVLRVPEAEMAGSSRVPRVRGVDMAEYSRVLRVLLGEMIGTRWYCNGTLMTFAKLIFASVLSLWCDTLIARFSGGCVRSFLERSTKFLNLLRNILGMP